MILVIDGQGGKLSRTLVENIKRCFPDVLMLAVGINAQATSAMLHGETDQVTIGENPVIVACRKADVIVGPWRSLWLTPCLARSFPRWPTRSRPAPPIEYLPQ